MNPVFLAVPDLNALVVVGELTARVTFVAARETSLIYLLTHPSHTCSREACFMTTNNILTLRGEGLGVTAVPTLISIGKNPAPRHDPGICEPSNDMLC